MPHDLSLFAINAVLILAPSGERILAKYYVPHSKPAAPAAPAFPTAAAQRAFETRLVSKTAKSAPSSDILLLDSHVVVYTSASDILLCIVGAPGENELLLWHALLCARDALALLLRNAVDKRTILENYDVVALAIEEVVDDGVLLETDPVAVAARVSRPPLREEAGGKVDLSEQGLLNAWELGKARLAERLRQGL